MVLLLLVVLLQLTRLLCGTAAQIKCSFGISKLKAGKKPAMGGLASRVSDAGRAETWSKARGKEMVGTGRSVLGLSP